MSALSTNTIYTDFNSLSLLRKEAGVNPESDATLREVAQQFESLFLHMMLKSMRSAVPESELMSSQQTTFYQEMLDQQLSTELPKQGGLGLADIIVQQLGGGASRAHRPDEFADDFISSSGVRNDLSSAVEARQLAPSPVLDGGSVNIAQSREQFIRDVIPSIDQASQSLGVQRDAILAQVILETGWGQSIIHDSEGRSSHNLFGIKADDRWQGERITAKTYEFVDGALQARYEDFRAYASYEASISDYVDFLHHSPRYQDALAHGADAGIYAEKIQQAGYATDPAYADKVKSIIAGETYKTLVANIELRAG